MTDYMHREDAPLSGTEWEQLDNVVTKTARQHLVGRRFIPVFGPFGAGMQTIHHDVHVGDPSITIDMTGEGGTPLGTGQREYKRLPILHKDFQIHWRDIETSHRLGVPLDLSLAAASAFFVANAEDNLIFHGNREQGLEGIFNTKQRNKVSKGDWTQPGVIFQDVVNASEKLGTAGFYGPYALVLSPKLFALANRVYENTGVLEIAQIEKIADGGVFRSSVLGENQAVLISTGAQNMDLAISQDLATAYLDTDNMNHLFRVMEILTLRIKRPGAICTFE